MYFAHRFVPPALGPLIGTCATVGGSLDHDNREVPRTEFHIRLGWAVDYGKHLVWIDCWDLVYHGGAF